MPITPEHPSVAENRATWAVLETFEHPVLTAFGDKDAVTSGGEKVFIDRIPSARGQPHRIIAGGGHFIQEDAPDELCAMIDDLIRADMGVPA